MAPCTFAPELSTKRGQRPTNASSNPAKVSTSSGTGQGAGAEHSAGSSWSSCDPPSDGNLEQHRHHRHPSNNKHGELSGANGRVQSKEEEEELGVDRSREAAGGGLERRRALPDGWSTFVAPEGREYYFYAPTGTVQWERPVG